MIIEMTVVVVLATIMMNVGTMLKVHMYFLRRFCESSSAQVSWFFRGTSWSVVIVGLVPDKAMDPTPLRLLHLLAMVFNWLSKYISSFNYFSRVLFIVLQMFCLFPMNNIFFHMYMITIGLLIALCSTLMGLLLPHMNNCYFILDVTYAVLYIDLIIGLTEICFERVIMSIG
ncbi:hypothetical protein HanHA89_Chr11g0405641 [Helianthus annuus]|nr:hypothetical protein HanHA89_Chr11g0405641 [Helianthus annuus]